MLHETLVPMLPDMLHLMLLQMLQPTLSSML
jgi:hypothetical protein